MGTVKGNWLTGAHSGRACNHENIYTKVDKKTGKCYSVKLCNPNETTTETQATQRTNFGKISAAICAWIRTEKEKMSDAYKSIKTMFDRQTKYATMRGYMMARNMAVVQDDGSVKITAAGADSIVSPDSGSTDQKPSQGGGSQGSGSDGSGSDGSGSDGSGSDGSGNVVEEPDL